MKVVIINYNAGNVKSVLFAFERVGVQAVVSDNPEEINSADKVIFPGVGEASTAMKYLRQNNLDKIIKDLKQPVLGICLGMQLMCAHSEENDTTCLGIFDEPVKRFTQQGGPRLKIPQIGWNKIYNLKSELMKGVEEGFCYFVHSYYAALGPHTIATADYTEAYSAGLHKNNFFGLQFHPEKSAETGEKILMNFLTRI